MNKLLVLFFIGLVVCIPHNEEREIDPTNTDTDTTTTPTGTGTTEPDVTTTPAQTTTPENTATDEEKTCGSLQQNDWIYEVDVENKNRTIAYQSEFKFYYKEEEVELTLVREYNSPISSEKVGFVVSSGDLDTISKAINKGQLDTSSFLDARYLTKLNSTINTATDGIYSGSVSNPMDATLFERIYNSNKVNCLKLSKFMQYDAAYGVVPAIFSLFLILIALF